MEDTKTIRFSNMTKFMFNEDQAIIFNRLNGQWIKVPKQCYDILERFVVRLVAMTALRKKCGLESSMVIQKAVSTMTPLTLLRVLPGGNT